ncbi:MAG: TerC family protein [Gemmatimonadaceae bacterium]
METKPWFWIAFNAFVLGMLALDLGVFHRKAHVIKPREAATWTAVWASLALLFAAGLLYLEGSHVALTFLTGYVIEQSLSVDNIFVIVMIFAYFGVPSEFQHRVLFWGIVGALVMRGIFIGLGALLLAKFHWIIYVFGALLIYTGIGMALRQDEEFDAERNRLLRLARRYLPFTDEYDGQKFFTVRNGARVGTPLFLVLIMVEFTDLIFAVDSIPAIFAITSDPFLVYTSNIFAILGLRSLYFLLAGMVDKFHLLKYGLAVILTFVGIKMVIAELYVIPIFVSLGVILLVLALSIGLSLLYPAAAELDGHEIEGKTGSLFGALPRRRSTGKKL